MIRREMGKDGICVLTFDRPESGANIFDAPTMQNLSEHLDAIEKDPSLRGVLVTSAKKSIFIAGADLKTLLKQAQAGELRAEDRRAFFAYASQVMRSVIVSSVRERIAEKRGGDWRPLTLSTKLAANVANDEDTVLRVHEALEDLEKAEPRLAQVAQMRYFGGYSEQEIAETLDVTERTVQRDWEKARLILAAALR